jgi:hypothetical protein
MMDALLAADQHVDEGLLNSRPSGWSTREESSDRGSAHEDIFGVEVRGFPLRLVKGETEYGRYESNPSPLVQGRIRNGFHGTRPQEARRALDRLAHSRRNRESQNRLDEEASWIAANSARFAGRWIALLGSQLLAIGDSAREVFDLASGVTPTPLIIQVQEEPLSFAGW